MKSFIESISIENYRGFREKQTIGLAECGNMTFLVGQNNSGKSLVAKILSTLDMITGNSNETFPKVFVQNKELITDSDYFDQETLNPISIIIKFGNESIQDIFTRYNASKFGNIIDGESVRLCLKIHKNGGNIEVYSFLSIDGKHSYGYVSNKGIYERSQVDDILAEEENIVRELLRITWCSFLIFSSVRSFSAEDYPFCTGAGTIDFFGKRGFESEQKALKIKMNSFLKKLNLDIPVNSDVVDKQLVFTFSNHLKLSSASLGTGYSMVYILLMEILMNKKKIIVIDEIENHLHPGLVRELIKILREIGINQQFIIATHSPTVMESATENDHLYHFQKIDSACVIKKFYKGNNTNGDLRTVGNDLGIIPGDALLSNCVIWVEGPSEILWLRAWMKNYLPIYLSKHKLKVNILEGLHYSILMTGGSLIANIDFDDESKTLVDIEDDFGLKVLRVNPNPFVMIDSDNSTQTSAKWLRCLDIANELHSQNKICAWNKLKDDAVINDTIYEVQNFWLLKGRELENYAHPELLREFYILKSKHSGTKIKGVGEITDWNVYCSSKGVGAILEDQGAKGIKKASGTIIHKSDLASYVFRNFNEKHFEEKPDGILCPDKAMIQDLTTNLNKLFEYIFTVNNLK